MILNLANAEVFVRKTPGYSWDGWTIEQFVPNDRAATRVNGAFRNGVWGFLNRYEVNEKGKYNLRHSNKSVRS